MVRVGKKTPQKKMGERSAAKKGRLCTMLMQGQELDERM
jgi:hypothetical protein